MGLRFGSCGEVRWGKRAEVGRGVGKEELGVGVKGVGVGNRWGGVG